MFYKFTGFRLIGGRGFPAYFKGLPVSHSRRRVGFQRRRRCFAASGASFTSWSRLQLALICGRLTNARSNNGNILCFQMVPALTVIMSCHGMLTVALGLVLKCETRQLKADAGDKNWDKIQLIDSIKGEQMNLNICKTFCRRFITERRRMFPLSEECIVNPITA